MAKPHLLLRQGAYRKEALSHATASRICFEQHDIESLKADRHMAARRPEAVGPHTAPRGPKIFDSPCANSDRTSEALERYLRAPCDRIRPAHWCSRRVAAPDAFLLLLRS